MNTSLKNACNNIMLCPTDVTQSQYAVSTVYHLTPILVAAYLATNNSN